MSLLDTISVRPLDSVIFMSQQGSIRISHLLDWCQAYRLKGDGRYLEKHVIDSVNHIDFLKTVIASDGFASNMLLLPSGLDKLDRQHLLSNYKAIEIKSSDADNQNAVVSNWFLTTSGTTGSPKIVNHTLKGLSKTVRRDSKVGSSLRWGLLYSPARYAGLQVVLQSLLGHSCLIVPDSESLEERVRFLISKGCNAISATPSLWRKMLMLGGIKQLSLQLISLGGEIADQSTLDALIHAFPKARITHIYASTEGGVGFAVRDQKAGFPIHYLESENDSGFLRVNEDGCLLLPLKDSKRRYWSNNGDKMLIDEGYFNTQDLVERCGGRYLFRGRLNGSINVGGDKVYPEQVEHVIAEIEGIVDVRVYGKANSILGQLVSADIVLAPNLNQEKVLQAVRNRCTEILLPYMRPVLVKVVDDIVLESSGKKRRG